MWRVGIFAILVTAATLIVSGDFRASVIIGLIFAILVLLLAASTVVVPEHKAAVIYNRLKHYTGLRRPGVAVILPVWEHVGLFLDLGPKTAHMTLRDIRTGDQVPVAISLNLMYRLIPWAIRAGLQPQLVDDLERFAPSILQNQAEHLLHQLVGKQNITSLLQPGGRTYLEDHLGRELRYEASRFGIEISGQVMLSNIELPEALQAEINHAQQTRIHTRARADALTTLREALGTQPDQSWEAVIELEAVDAMGRNRSPIFFPFSAGWNGSAFDDANSHGEDK